MTVRAHIDALNEKHAFFEESIRREQARPQPDFTAISEWKKQKLQVKQEIANLAADQKQA